MVFDKAWFNTHQSKLLWLLNSKLTRRWFRWVMCIDNPAFINRIEPNAYWFNAKHVNSDQIQVTADFRTNDKYARRLYYGFRPFWHLLHILDKPIDLFVPSLSFGFATLTAFSGSTGLNNPMDGTASRGSVNETFGTIQSSAGNTSNAGLPGAELVLHLVCSTTSNQFSELIRHFHCYDTSSLTSSASISAAVVSLNGKGAGFNGGGTAPNINIASSTPTNSGTGTVTNGDYSNCGSTSFSSLALTSWVGANTYNDFTLDSNGIANISLTGISKFSTRLSWDLNNSFTGTWASTRAWEATIWSAKETGTTLDPKLVVTYTLSTATANTTTRLLMRVGL